jgi:hypothetical protein
LNPRGGALEIVKVDDAVRRVVEWVTTERAKYAF